MRRGKALPTSSGAGVLAFAGATSLTVLLAAGALVAVERVLTRMGTDPPAPLSPSSVVALAGGETTALVLVVLLATVVVATAERLSRLSPRWPPSRIGGGLAALLTFAPLHRLGRELTAGDWIAQQSYVWAVRWAVPLVIAPALGGLVWACLRFEAGRANTGALARSLTPLLLLGSIGAALANRFVQPSLYPSFHILAHLVTIVLVLPGLHRLTVPRIVGTKLARAALVPGPLALATLMTAWLAMSAHTRAELLLRSPVAAPFIRAFFRPDPQDHVRQQLEQLELDADVVPEASIARGLIQTEGDWNVLIVMVDTLRADALLPLRNHGRLRYMNTPFLDAWVSKAFHFTHVYAQAPQTHRSLPAMFRSLEVFEAPNETGVGLAEYATELGRVPVAVVNNYFIEPRFRAELELLNGFEHIEVYDRPAMESTVDRTIELLESVEGRPFLAWVHFYNMHSPGFDGRELGAQDGSWLLRYRRSLRWLDRQLARLDEELERIGVRDRTIIILAADHGEGLGDNGVKNHGPTVFEEEMRVPLLIDVPGRRGHRIDTVVGNIDVVPTIGDLLGGRASRHHRGRSLVPLMVDETAAWSRNYYLENKDGTVVGLVDDRDKLILDVEGDAIYRFDLDDDPRENENVWNPEAELDRAMLGALVRRNPALFQAELEQEDTQQLLARRLEAASGRQVDEPLRFLVRLAVLAPSPALIDRGIELFEQTPDSAVRLFLVDEMFASEPRRWASTLERYMDSLAGSSAELEFVEGLARQHQPPFARSRVAARLTWWVENGDPNTWEPWLRLLSNWRALRSTQFAPVLVEIFARLAADETSDAAELRRLALEVVAGLRAPGRSHRQPLQKYAVALVADPDPSVQAAACRALATVGSSRTRPLLRSVALDRGRDPRARQAALRSVVARAGADAVGLLEEASDDPLLTVDTIKLAQKIGSQDAIPFLRRIESTHYNSLIRKRARKAVKAIVEIEQARKAPPPRP